MIQTFYTKLRFVFLSNNIAELVPKEFVFGKPCKYDFYAFEDLIKDADHVPCLLKRDYLVWMETLNELRNCLRRRDTTQFTLKQFFERLSYYDQVGMERRLS